LATSRATAIRLAALVGGRSLLGEDFADFEEEVFDVGELGPPSGALRAVELLDQVFGDSLDVGAQFFHLRGALLGSRHPWLLSELGPNG
jgi:hypothetical protein